MNKLLVAIPALNEENTISNVILAVPGIEGIDAVEVLVVDDGSGDNTFEKAVEAGAKVLRHQRNLGLGKAFGTALEYARQNGFTHFVTLDADGQFNPAHIPLLLEPILKGNAQFVTASRFIDPDITPDMPRIKRMGNRLVAGLVGKLSGIKLCDATCGFRAYGPEAIEKISSFNRFTYTHEVIIDLAAKGIVVHEIPLEIQGRREYGRSRIAGNLSRYALLSLAAMYSVAHDHYPGRFFGIPALIITLIGLAGEIFVFIHWLMTGMVTPYKGVALAGLFLVTFGILLFLFASLADTASHNRKLIESVISEQTRKNRK